MLLIIVKRYVSSCENVRFMNVSYCCCCCCCCYGDDDDDGDDYDDDDDTPPEYLGERSGAEQSGQGRYEQAMKADCICQSKQTCVPACRCR